jgi:peptide/nickel transport system substrate-binding protein
MKSTRVVIAIIALIFTFVLASCQSTAAVPAATTVAEPAAEEPAEEAVVAPTEEAAVEEPVEEVTETPAEEVAPEEAAPEETGTDEPTEFVFAHEGPIRTMDAPVTWYGSTHWLTNTLYDCLIWRNADSSGYVGQAAESWEALDDVTWRFYLRPGLTFQNGEPLDAEAVAWNLNRVMTREDFLVFPQWQFISEVNVIDDTTIDVITDGPKSSFEFDISYNGCELLPPDYMAEVGEEEFARNPVGSGPYKLTEFTESDRYVFEAWDDYWAGRPEVDRIIYQVIPEIGSQIAALLAGQVDFVSNVPGPELERLMNTEGLTVMSAPGGRQHLLEIRSNSTSGAMQETYDGYVVTTEDKLIRQAISRALDRELLAEVQGGARPSLLRADEFYPEHRGQWAGQEAAINFYDPDLARQLIIEAGYDPDAGNSPLVHLDAMTFQAGNDKEVAEVAAAMLEEVGFTVELNILDTAAYSEQILQPGNNREAILEVIGSNPQLIPIFYHCDWSDVEDDICPIVEGEWQGISEAIVSTIDFDERMALWERFWDFYVDEALEVTLYHTVRNVAINSAEFEWEPRNDGWFTFRDLRLVNSGN